jgi:soluble lytic murein transglycosylase
MKAKQILLRTLLAGCLTGCSVVPTIAPTISPSPTLLQGSTPSVTTLPTLTPSPTPTPEARVATGDQAFFDGDYNGALTEYQAAFDTSSDMAVKAAGLWGLGMVYYALKNNARALETLWQLTSLYPASPNAGRAYFMMGEIYTALQRYSEAAQAYTIYLTLRPGVLDAFTQERRGDAYNAAGDYSDAISAWKVALTAPQLGNATSLNIKIARAYFSNGDSSTALTMMDAITAATSNDYVKAQMDLLSGQIYLSLEQPDPAYQRFLDAVNNYPLAYDSYSALVSLVNANVTVDDLNRGLVDYFAGQYGYALDAFQRYLTTNPQNDGTVIYYEALTYYHLGQYEDAVATWKLFVQNYPNNTHWVNAWDGDSSLPGIAYTQWYWLNDSGAAEQTLLTFIQQSPNDPEAPNDLMDVARIQERDGKLEDASKTWDQVASDYPSSVLVPQALFWSAISLYRLGSYNDALVAFQRDSILSTTPDDQARAYFWIGKAQQALGDTNSAHSTWQQTASLDPTAYYSLRAQDMLLNRQPFTSTTTFNFSIDWSKERKDAETWIRVTFNLPTDTDLSTPGSLRGDPRLVRGTELLTLGLTSDALLEFNDLQTSLAQNPADLYRLANYLLTLGLYNPAIFAIRQILTLAGMSTQAQTLAAPAFFNHVRYGLYYQDLVIPAAQQTGFDPLFLYSVIRQESLFDMYAQSPYAFGLMQMTPDTEQIVANNLGWPPNYYTSDDLFRPTVSIDLGTTYLMTQRIGVNGDLYSVLASYNAGPAATPIWRDLSGLDSDLFLEIIRYQETRDYISSIYEIYNMYRLLYETIH